MMIILIFITDDCSNCDDNFDYFAFFHERIFQVSTIC